MRFRVKTKKGSWDVFLFLELFDIEEVESALIRAGANREDISNCLSYYNKGGENGGFTFSNPDLRISVVCVFNSDSLPELLNTLFHEARHLERHICKADGIDPYSEEAGYLAGEIVRNAVLK